MGNVLYISYDNSPSQDHLINAISISRKWSIHNLFKYSMDHLRRQFLGRQIHAAVVLGVCRKFGIPDLIEQAVFRLAKPSIPLSSWSTDPEVTCHLTVFDIGTIGRMKEKLLLARIALCCVPPITHDVGCYDRNRVACAAAWRDFWVLNVVPKLSNV